MTGSIVDTPLGKKVRSAQEAAGGGRGRPCPREGAGFDVTIWNVSVDTKAPSASGRNTLDKIYKLCHIEPMRDWDEWTVHVVRMQGCTLIYSQCH